MLNPFFLFLQLMLKIIRDNSVFFCCFFLFFIFGIVLFFSIEKGDAILFFGENRNPVLDTFFIYWTKLGEEYLYVLAFIIFLFVKMRYSLLVLVTAFFVLIVSGTLKLLFAHDRPKIWFMKMKRIEEVNFVEGINVLVGPTSFPSGHAMSAFALYSVVAFFLIKKKMVAVLLFVTALLIAVSRVYLVHHFFEDVLVGSTIGIFIAMLVYYLQGLKTFPARHWLDEPLLGKKKTPRA